MDHSFSKESFLKITTKLDPKRFRMGRSRKDYLAFHEKNIEKLKYNNFVISEILTSQTPMGVIKHIHKSCPHAIFAVRKANVNIKDNFKVRATNRENIINQVIQMLMCNEPKGVIRLDLKAFYESIPLHHVIPEITDDYRINHETKKVVSSIYTDGGKYTALHRGISLSSTISELYMQKIDKAISHIPGVYYYARFVDDMVIFCTGKTDKIKREIKRLLPQELVLNSKKSQVVCIKKNQKEEYFFDSDEDGFEYLGYYFKLKITGNKKKKIELDVSMAKKKKNKIKTRIVMSLKSFIKTGDERILFDRLKYLTGNFSVKGGYGRNKLYSGIYFNYKAMEGMGGCKQSLSELDGFLNSTIFSPKSKLGSKVILKLGKRKAYALTSLSFSKGFKEKKIIKFTEKKISEIRKAWEDVA